MSPVGSRGEKYIDESMLPKMATKVRVPSFSYRGLTGRQQKFGHLQLEREPSRGMKGEKHDTSKDTSRDGEDDEGGSDAPTAR